MKLRKLETKDAEPMLEWMHDDSVVHHLRANFAEKTIDDCRKFIEAAKDERTNLHLAVVDENDEYMGTVSLKNINKESAEFGITVRKVAMGKGYSNYAMKKIIEYGLCSLNLKNVFWYVSPENKRAVRFYDKNEYERITPEKLSLSEEYNTEEMHKYCWYVVTKADIDKVRIAD